jgi:predicted nucleic acid-binding protein
MRVVLDTNVLVSAALKQQSMPGMAVLLVERHHLLLKSPATEGQLFAVVAPPYFVSLISADTRAWLTRLMTGTSSRNLSSVGSRHSAIRSAMVTSSAAAPHSVPLAAASAHKR